MGQTPSPDHTSNVPLVPGNGDTFLALRLDVEAYVHHLAETDWTEEQKREFIEALWQIIVGIIDLQYPLSQPARSARLLKTLDEESPSMVALETNSDITEVQDGEARA